MSTHFSVQLLFLCCKLYFMIFYCMINHLYSSIMTFVCILYLLNLVCILDFAIFYW